MRNISLFAAATLLISSLGVSAAERLSLFDGKTLKNWTLVTCEAVVDNGELLIKGGNGLVQTERKYKDFVFEFDWKPLKEQKWDSGVYFKYEGISAIMPWPLRYQVNLKQGAEGNVADLEGAKSTGLVKAGDWNTFKLTVRGTDAAMEINGKPAWKATGIDGPAESHIGLQAEVTNGGQHRFRNLYITELK